ncbi:MAG: hemolysin family protein [bacterium]|nr:hemolysin family protein [bacterium]
MDLLNGLAALAVTLLLSGFLSASELAFTGLGRSHVLIWLRQGRAGAAWTAAWHRRPDSLLVTLLVANNLSNISFATIATLVGLHLGWPEWVTGLAATILLTVGGEALPKGLIHGRSHRLFPALALPLQGIHLLLKPISAPVALFTRLLPGQPEREAHQLRAQLHQLSEDLGQREHRMIRRALHLRQRRLGELMTPRTELLALPADASPALAAELIHREGKSALPLYRRDLDSITGYITARDLFQLPATLDEIRRQPLFVPATMRARDLLAAFGKGQSKLAVVVDEYGGTAGLLTLEDLLEDLVGAIDDEHDKAQRSLIPLADGRFFVSARLRLDIFAEGTGLQLPTEAADTLGGWVVEQLGRIPAEGERLLLPPLEVSIVSATPRHLRHVIVQHVPSRGNGEGQDQDGQPGSPHASTPSAPSLE